MESDTGKYKILSVIAHDLKEPLNAVSGIAELLLSNWDDFDENEKLTFIEDIHKSCDRTRSLLEDLLIWSKGHSNNFLATKKDFNITRILEKNLEIANMNAASKGIRINCDVDNDIFVHADEDMISTVIRNLITNAIKYIDPGCEINISAKIQNGFCRFKIEDNGMGIKDPRIIKLFNEKSESSSPQMPSYKKNGLGLILCKDFISRNGGNIWFDSIQSQGTTFYFTVPLPELTLPLG
ncbi:MAG: HAMP domain-containing histidine kinase [Prolixibacteraceae bacterium]|nr:HAMP domain-containing histidine kinase [Prolixibacteraceae bacterium]MBN2774384.1 HAMP domain-containing histidine kinase [Prolixibacteraceae bacterium]